MNSNVPSIFAGLCLLQASTLFALSGTVESTIIPLELSAGVFIAAAIASILLPGWRTPRNSYRQSE